ncbi:hypothetical protein FALCPG4_007082 [Fusarium falciforme]
MGALGIGAGLDIGLGNVDAGLNKAHRHEGHHTAEIFHRYSRSRNVFCRAYSRTPLSGEMKQIQNRRARYGTRLFLLLPFSLTLSSTFIQLPASIICSSSPPKTLVINRKHISTTTTVIHNG